MDHSKNFRLFSLLQNEIPYKLISQNTQIQLKLIVLEKLTPRGLHSLGYPLSPDQR